MLEEIKNQNTEVSTSDNRYFKHFSNVSENMITIDNHRIKWRTLDYLQERDGVRVPHIVKQIFCNPPAPIELLQKNINLKETIND